MSLEIFSNEVYRGDVVDPQLLGDKMHRDTDRHDAQHYYRLRSLDKVTYDSLSSEYGRGWWSGHNFLLPGAFVFFCRRSWMSR
ncbi:hypothetical protein [Hydrogenophaga sp. BPS33]|uniref:hypothetical protein n=1 Tax=Hydrogenophaga sp. BPS33 TaxID=2651974 RepID=UPI00131F9046|nr:hypothetical protein [Hydrogenophaga sp. BPS33]QHE87239.1 hypothetical protein F9K07_21235 [Hydrogenophaga sp. BPS33]